jgi:UDP-N-acetylglucosamine acyltransferase
MGSIHPTAIIHSKAELDSSVEVGPYTVIEAGVKIGKGSKIGPHCHLIGTTSLGENTRIHAGCVLGDTAQDLSYQGAPTSLVVGNGNTFREHVTVHRGTKEGTATTIGDGNYFMANAHIAHNCSIGNHVIIANAVLLGGYVEIQDRAFLGGGTVVHQFTRVGTLSILQGLTRITKDVPPFCTAIENNELGGLNSIGMKRAGLSIEQRSKLKKAYATFFLEGFNISQAIEELEKQELTPEVHLMVRFIRHSKRGVCTARKKTFDLEEE